MTRSAVLICSLAVAAGVWGGRLRRGAGAPPTATDDRGLFRSPRCPARGDPSSLWQAALGAEVGGGKLRSRRESYSGSAGAQGAGHFLGIRR